MCWRKNFCYWLIVTCEVHRVRAAGADAQLVIAKPANGTEKKTCRPPGVIVVGVSRSGTSIATSILGRLGAHLGNVAKGPYQNHPDGKNEFKPAVVVNKGIYDADGLTWDELPRPLSPGTRTRRDLVDRAIDALAALNGAFLDCEDSTDWWAGKKRQTCAGIAKIKHGGKRKRICEGLMSDDGKKASEACPKTCGTCAGWDSCAPGAWWALKDPRFTITLPIWLAAAKRLRLKVTILFVWREPAPNARSLDVHGHFEDSRRRWQAINSVALAEIVDEVCVQLAYTDLVSGAERRLDAITRLAQRLYAVKIPVASRGRLQVNTSIADLPFMNKAEDNLDALTPSQADLAKRLRSSQCGI